MAHGKTLELRKDMRTKDAPEPIMLFPEGYISRRHQQSRRPRWVTGLARGKGRVVDKAAPCKNAGR